jgi:tRNA_anti-like
VRHWGFWEWVAYAGLFVAAIIMATDTGFKLNPTLTPPDFIHSAAWGFAPLALIVFSTCTLVLREFVFSGRKVSKETVSHPAVVAKASATRVFVSDAITPEFLSAFSDGHTAMQANELIKPYVGKWMKVTGQIRNVESHRILSMLTFESADQVSGIPIMCFTTEWTDRLAMLRRGEGVTVVGRITGASQHSVSLENCELVE